MLFTRYVALGDSLSIDRYPALAQAVDGVLPEGLGAAALLYRNADSLWPEFIGRDLVTYYPGIAFRNRHRLDHPASHPTDHYATDGATTVSVLAYQLHRVAASTEPTLVTLTAGRDDVLRMLGAPRPPATLVAGMTSRVERLLRTVQERLPNALVILTTVPDPTDGGGWLDEDTDARRELAWLAEYNEALRRLATREDVRLADVARHFAGHGLGAPDAERWVLAERPFDVNARGASEVRRTWLEALSGR